MPDQPRVRGEHLSEMGDPSAFCGSAPRARGTLFPEPADSLTSSRCKRAHQLVSPFPGTAHAGPRRHCRRLGFIVDRWWGREKTHSPPRARPPPRCRTGRRPVRPHATDVPRLQHEAGEAAYRMCVRTPSLSTTTNAPSRMSTCPRSTNRMLARSLRGMGRGGATGSARLSRCGTGVSA